MAASFLRICLLFEATLTSQTLAIDTEQPVLDEPESGIRTRGRGVLVVEADPDLQWRIARTLTVEGNRVVGASTGEAALALLGQWSVDLVLVDENLPGIDGIELIRRLADTAPDMTLILLTDSDDPDLQVTARLAGATSCIHKPFRADVLQAVLTAEEMDFGATAAE